MRYTVKKLAALSGVTVRTLHHYDQIGLLRPAYQGENNYRYYEEEQLLLLQQILLYREMGMPLEEIGKIVSAGNFNKMLSLKAHKLALNKELDRMKKMIQTVDKTIKHLEGGKSMEDKELFYGIDSPRQKGYEKYLIEKGVCTQEDIDTSRENAKKVDWDAMKKKWDQLFKDYVDAIQKNLKPASPEVLKIAKRHSEIIKVLWGKDPTKESFIGLSQQYQSHPDWLKMFNSYHPCLLDFLTKAMKAFADQEL